MVTAVVWGTVTSISPSFHVLAGLGAGRHKLYSCSRRLRKHSHLKTRSLAIIFNAFIFLSHFPEINKCQKESLSFQVLRAWRTIRRACPFPAVTGRVNACKFKEVLIFIGLLVLPRSRCGMSPNGGVTPPHPPSRNNTRGSWGECSLFCVLFLPFFLFYMS